MNARWFGMRSIRALVTLFVALLAALCGTAVLADSVIRVGSKNFNESYLLAEVVSQRLEAEGFAVERTFGLGGTLICYQALKSGEIDVYVEYTGTLSQAVLSLERGADLDVLASTLEEQGLALLPGFGFNNTYALVTRSDYAQQRGVRTIGDLAHHPDARIVFSHEFLERGDGWPGLRALYDLPQQPAGIEHGLAYQAIADGSVDVMDAYSTDGELKRYNLVTLLDDRGYFPTYLAHPLVRDDFPPAAASALEDLAGSLNETRMQALNAEVSFHGRAFADVAAAFLGGETAPNSAPSRFRSDLVGNTLQHLKLTGIALGLATVIGLAASMAVHRRPALARALVYACGLLQTIPSIALLALMIPLFGIGVFPAVVALFLYSLLPILRNAVTALTTVDANLVRVARGLGLTPRQRLRHVLLPLSLPAILAGVRTAAVISIGTATLAAFIGAGGLGDPIVTGLSLNDVGLILEGAVPAAALAIATELMFEGVERWLLPGHLRRQGLGSE